MSAPFATLSGSLLKLAAIFLRHHHPVQKHRSRLHSILPLKIIFRSYYEAQPLTRLRTTPIRDRYISVICSIPSFVLRSIHAEAWRGSLLPMSSLKVWGKRLKLGGNWNKRKQWSIETNTGSELMSRTNRYTKRCSAEQTDTERDTQQNG